MSAESGISTFRDSGGLWEQYKVEDVASIEGYYRNPELVINFYNNMRKQMLEKKPCRGHELLAELENDFDITVVTQNVDNLHERAGSSNVIHLHGELMKVTSSKSPNCPRYIRELTKDNLEIKMGEKCEDGSQVRPFIVWFGEQVPKLEDAIVEAQQADIFLIIGTSLNVYPAASLINFVPSNAEIYLIDPKVVSVPSDRNVHIISKGASKGMEEFIKLVKNS